MHQHMLDTRRSGNISKKGLLQHMDLNYLVVVKVMMMVQEPGRIKSVIVSVKSLVFGLVDANSFRYFDNLYESLQMSYVITEDKYICPGLEMLFTLVTEDPSVRL